MEILTQKKRHKRNTVDFNLSSKSVVLRSINKRPRYCTETLKGAHFLNSYLRKKITHCKLHHLFLAAESILTTLSAPASTSSHTSFDKVQWQPNAQMLYLILIEH